MENHYVILLRTLLEKPESTQRELAKQADVSLGKLNQEITACCALGYLSRSSETEGGRGRNVSFSVTEKGREMLADYRVDSALILASGFGSRFVPLTYETPKGLLPVFGERMIERQIRQLHEAGITDISLMVGYLKEKFDYLIDKFGVKLIYNPEFSCKNTLATLYHARELLQGKNCYILSSDNWMRENMYHHYEPYAWYAASFMPGPTREWAMHFGKNGILKSVQIGGEDSWCMYGPVYFTREFSAKLLPLIEAYYRMPGTEQFYWEDVLIRNLKTLPPMHVNRQPENQIYEFENLEELRQFDPSYLENSGSEAMALVSRVLAVPESDIVEIRCLKAGMTNKSWLFRVKESAESPQRGRCFICRIPGPGTGKLINRRQEASVYQAVQPLGITEELIYFDPESGYKISRYYAGARNADYAKPEERECCMAMLKKLHNSGIQLGHAFDIHERLGYYESLCRADGHEISFQDYPEIREKAGLVLRWLESLHRPRTICHIDAVKDNFIFTEEGLKMIDWEYCGMADPLIDIAMAAIYSYMSFDEARELLAAYLAAPCTDEGGNAVGPGIADGGEGIDLLCLIVTAYMGLGGLLWALWCDYKISLGESFGDYTLRMYRYFKDSYQILRNFGKI